MNNLNALIAQGGTGQPSPVQRYLQSKDQMRVNQMRDLSMQSTRQQMGMRQEKQATEQQEREMKISASFMRNVQASPNPQAAYAQAAQELQNRAGIKSPPQYNPQMVKGLVEHVYGAPKGEAVNVMYQGKLMNAIEDESGNYIDERTRQPLYGATKASSKGQTINIDTKGESELSKALNKEFGRDLITRRNDAIQAKDSLVATNDAIDLLDSGVITGTGAEYITSAGKMLRRIGINYFDDDVKNTEAYYANQAKQVAQVIKAFGAGTGLSDADREYAEKAAAGKITMSEGSLRKIIEMNQSASARVIGNFNKDVRKLKKGVSPFDLSIEVPAMKSPAAKQDEWSIKAL